LTRPDHRINVATRPSPLRLAQSRLEVTALSSPFLAVLDTLDPAIIWVLVAIACFVVEMLVPAFIVGPFGITALFAAVAAWLGASVPVQLVVFGALGLVLVFPARRYLNRTAPKLKLGAETLPGKLATCLEAIDGDLRSGVVSLDGARWTAIAARGTHIAAGATVEVAAVQGVRLVVVPREGAVRR